MTLAAAHRFVLRIPSDTDLRRSLNAARTTEERCGALEQSVGLFSNELFEEAIRSLHVRCQTAEQAEELMELRLWWQLVVAHSTAPEQT